jgi:hypothetical protein
MPTSASKPAKGQDARALQELDEALPAPTVVPRFSEVDSSDVPLAAPGDDSGDTTRPETRPAENVQAPRPAEAPVKDEGAPKAKTYVWVPGPGGELKRVLQEEAEATQQPKREPPTHPQQVLEKTAKPGEGQKESSDPFQWEKADAAGMSRVIAIELDKLGAGDPRMNIIIRDKDVVHVPVLEVGEFYMLGEFNRPGAYSLTGRKITVKQAVATAYGFGQLAWPENAVLIRRTGASEEQMIPLNLERILRGQDKDIFLKVNDTIAVGSDVKAPFLAVLRNALRITYGVGLVYDRNLANPVIPGYSYDSRRFKRW